MKCFEELKSSVVGFLHIIMFRVKAGESLAFTKDSDAASNFSGS